MNALAECREVDVTLSRQPILRHVSLAIHPGERLGLVGTNGAGKTTLLSVLAGLTAPTSGSVAVDRAHRSPVVGGVVGTPAFYEYATAWENLSLLWTRTRGAERVAELLEVVGLGDERDVPVRNLSAGMRQRLAIARSLLPDPAVLLLDEPFTALDLEWQRWLVAFLDDWAARQRATVVVSHHLADIDRTCDRLVILSKGSIVLDQPTENLDLTTATLESLHETSP